MRNLTRILTITLFCAAAAAPLPASGFTRVEDALGAFTIESVRDAALAPDGRSLVFEDKYCCTQLHVLSLIDGTVSDDVSPGQSVDRVLYDGTAAAFLSQSTVLRRRLGDPQEIVVTPDTPVPGEEETFGGLLFLPGGLADGVVVFIRQSPSQIWTEAGGGLRLLYDGSDLPAGGVTPYGGFNGVSVRGGAVAFATQTGLYLGDIFGTPAQTITTTAESGFSQFQSFVLLDRNGRDVLFRGVRDGKAELALVQAGSLHTVVNSDMHPPGTAAPFYSFGNAAIDVGRVVFEGRTAERSGLYHAPVPGVIEPLIEVGDSLDGGIVESVSTPTGGAWLAGSRALFSARVGGVNHAYLSDPLPLVADFEDLPVQVDDTADTDPSGLALLEIRDDAGDLAATARGPAANEASIVEEDGNKFARSRSDLALGLTWHALDLTSYIFGSLGPLDSERVYLFPNARGLAASSPPIQRDYRALAMSADARAPQGSPAFLRFALRQDGGETVIVTPPRPLGTSFQRYAARAADFTELVAGTGPFDFTRVESLSVALTTPADPAPAFTFDVDNIAVPEAVGATNAAAALLAIGALKRWKTTPRGA